MKKNAVRLLRSFHIILILSFLAACSGAKTEVTSTTDNTGGGGSGGGGGGGGGGSSPTLIERKVAVGEARAFAITTAGAAKSWGNNYEGVNGVYGQLGLGLGTATTRTTPQNMDAGTTYVSIVAGEIQNCGITNTQKIKCWATNIGDGTGVDKTSPTLISDAISDTYIDIASGSYHVCAILSSGVMKCWGDGWDGKLGNADGTGATQNAPVTADAGTSFKQVAAGRNHTCGLTLAGAIRCWGTNDHGQIGDGTVTTPVLTPYTVDSGTTYVSVFAGEDSTCGITSAGVLKCWGLNASGQLGDNSTTDRHSPTVIDAGTNYSQVSIGATFYYHTCGITSAGVLKCWGLNASGQLGNASTTATTVPVVVDAGVSYREVSVALNHSCGITTAGDLKCWGENGSSQLGLGDTADRNVPTLVGSGY